MGLTRLARAGDRRSRPRRLVPIGLGLLGALQVAWGLRQAVSVRRLRTVSSQAIADASRKTMFLRLASHEIRTPLALARGYVDIIRSETLGPIGPEVADALGSVDEKLRQIDELVTQMVETARLDAAGSGLRLTPLDMREVVTEAGARARERLGPDHELLVSCIEVPAMVMGERFRLLTVLVNLLGNAIKYSPEGGQVRCTLRARKDGVEVLVADQGIGLRPDEIRQLFQPFTRLPGGIDVASSGLGLGLHLSRTIAEAHGGTLTAGANPGGGSVFTLRLPRLG